LGKVDKQVAGGFGWAKIMRSARDFMRGPAGTAKYAPPEQQDLQLQQRLKQDCTVDTHCLVMLMLELSCGGLPYPLVLLIAAGDVQAMLKYIFRPGREYMDPTSPSFLPPAAQEFVKWGLLPQNERPSLAEGWDVNSSNSCAYLMSEAFPPSRSRYSDPYGNPI
jgi:hypothetical protein